MSQVLKTCRATAIFTLLICFAFINLNCDSASRKARREIVQLLNKALQEPIPIEFAKLYPDHRAHIITYRGSDRALIMETVIFERYHLLMKLPVLIGTSESRFKALSPSFVLKEFDYVEMPSEKRWHVRWSDENQPRFGESAWENLVHYGGDLHAVGIEPVLDKPVSNVAKYWEEYRPSAGLRLR